LDADAGRSQPWHGLAFVSGAFVPAFAVGPTLISCAGMLLTTASTVLFENDRIRVSDFRLPPGASGGLAEHTFPTVRWQVGAGLHQLNEASGSSPVEDKHVFWMEVGDPFVCTNLHTGDEYRQVCWEFKQPPKRTEAAVRDLLRGALYSTDVGTTMLFENAYCRVWDFFSRAGSRRPGRAPSPRLRLRFCLRCAGSTAWKLSRWLSRPL